jgi:hypothetical protein
MAAASAAERPGRAKGAARPIVTGREVSGAAASFLINVPANGITGNAEISSGNRMMGTGARNVTAHRPGAAVLVFRDPDNIQLELFAGPPS